MNNSNGLFKRNPPETYLNSPPRGGDEKKAQQAAQQIRDNAAARKFAETQPPEDLDPRATAFRAAFAALDRVSKHVGRSLTRDEAFELLKPGSDDEFAVLRICRLYRDGWALLKREK